MIDVSKFVETLDGKPIGVFGLGVSGQASVKALEAAGVQIIAWDDETGEPPQDFVALACLVLSPGVPLHYPEPHAVVKQARDAGIPIMCDIELFSRALPHVKTIGITGTNGKSTTAALLHHVLRECGVQAQLGGNIGRAVLDLDMPLSAICRPEHLPLCHPERLPLRHPEREAEGSGRDNENTQPDPSSQAPQDDNKEDDSTYILELSSYQLDLCPTFTPDIAVLLNITQDHLDRHGTMENYVASKAQIFEGAGDAVIATDDGFTQQIADDVETKGARHLTRVSAKDIDFETQALKGEHNQQNIAAVMTIARLLALDESTVRIAIDSFPGLAHRQFFVREKDGVRFINDSKATNVEATAKALQAYDDIYWIVGGQAKEGGLKGLEAYLGNVRSAFLIGEAANSFANWHTQQGLHYVKSNILKQAVEDAMTQIAKDKAIGDIEEAVVLLSPACASWDQFSSFEERGDTFEEIVRGL